MSISSVIVTGANRGIGLEFVKQLVKRNPAPSVIVATCRDPSKAEELQSLSKAHSNISIVQLEVKDYASHGAVANKVADLVKERGVDVLINNAGMYNKVSLESGGPELIVENVEVNAVAPLYLTRALLPLLRQSAKRKASGQKAVVANISSKMGSLTDNTSGGHYAYRTSKAAMNMVSKSLSVDLEPEGIRCVAVHPGWVQTDMGGPNALINTQTSVENMIETITRVATGELGSDGNIFLNYDGKLLPW